MRVKGTHELKMVCRDTRYRVARKVVAVGETEYPGSVPRLDYDYRCVSFSAVYPEYQQTIRAVHMPLNTKHGLIEHTNSYSYKDISSLTVCMN